MSLSLATLLVLAWTPGAGAAGVGGSRLGVMPPPIPADAARTFAEQNGIDEARAQADLEIQRKAPDIVDAMKGALGDGFAGLWFDLEEGRFHVDATGAADPEAGPALARDLGLTDEEVAFGEAEHSWSALAAAHTRVDEALKDELATGGMQTSIDPTANAVQVATTAERAPAVAKALAALPGDVTSMTEQVVRSGKTFDGHPEACDFGSKSCDRPLRGGVLLSGGGTGCTTGALAVRGTSRFMITAGHCANTSTPWYAQYAPNGYWYQIGYVNRSYFGLETDAENIDATGSFWDMVGWQPMTAVWGYSIGAPNWGVGSAYPGLLVYLEGSTTGTQGVTVQSVYVTHTYPGRGTVGNLMYGNGCIRGGDSGGPIQLNYYIYGFASGGDECNGSIWFADATMAAYYLNVTIATAG